MRDLLKAFEEIQRDLPLIFPIHPRTRQQLASAGLNGQLEGLPNLRLIDPQGYLDFLKLMADSAMVLTDSGGIQEETTILGVPCLTLRENTERPATITHGTNRLVGMDPQRLLEGYRSICAHPCEEHQQPEKWDGRAAERITRIIAQWQRD